MSHKFSVKDKKKLDNPERRKLLPPEATLEKLQLYKGDIVADVGCGIGYFSIPAALIVGEIGKIYAMDISTEMLSEVHVRATENNVGNIEIVKTVENSLIVDDESVTYAFICNVLHETNDLNSFLQEVKRILAWDGKVAIIEWKKQESHMGPPISHRIAEAELIETLKHMEFQDISKIDLGDEFYGIIGKKQRE
ncbi:class I SAM-dependent methyltransferase [Pelosinus baikalensis]|uniref:Methyltransferase domain-containing protein n=1 Tax=Pelosinus baikalensis TaxID=2892015 RepID=A0ABS8HSY1_9FIRM|nr:methyltransferase domain-containing protein [Pelosinus baikalensis]MCC5466296.1 methyltransferase domain-containing protein [Pelosinus baikalensis]